MAKDTPSTSIDWTLRLQSGEWILMLERLGSDTTVDVNLIIDVEKTSKDGRKYRRQEQKKVGEVSLSKAYSFCKKVADLLHEDTTEEVDL